MNSLDPPPAGRQAGDTVARPGPPPSEEAIAEGKAAASSPTIRLSLTRAQAEALLYAADETINFAPGTSPVLHIALLGARGILEAHLAGKVAA